MTRPLGQGLILYASYSTIKQNRSMMSKNKLMIKEFSLLCGVTVKTLRHYEKVGLLQPAEVDEWTGYRYYNVAQMQTLANIRRLKRIGFSLDEILDLSERGTLIPSPEMPGRRLWLAARSCWPCSADTICSATWRIHKTNYSTWKIFLSAFCQRLLLPLIVR